MIQKKEQKINFILPSTITAQNADCPSSLLINNQQQHYKPYIIPMNENYNSIMEAFKIRKHCHIAHTPKIRLINNESDYKEKKEVLLLVQQADIQFHRIVQLCTQEKILRIVYQIMETAEALSHLYGLFKFTNPMLKAVKGPGFLLWIHQEFSRNYCQFPLLQKTQSSIHQMILSLLIVLIKKMPEIQILQQIMLCLKQLSFQQVKKKLNQKMKRQKQIGGQHKKSPSLDRVPKFIIQLKARKNSIANRESLAPFEDIEQNPQSRYKKSTGSASTMQDIERMSMKIKQKAKPSPIANKFATLDQIAGKSKNNRENKQIKSLIGSTIFQNEEFYLYEQNWNHELERELINLLNN